MLGIGKSRSLNNRPLPQKRDRNRRRDNALKGLLRDWLLEDRCLLAGGPPYEFPTFLATSIDEVLYNGVSGQYEKTITITNNSPDQWIYGFLEGQNSRMAVDPYNGTGAFDPFDPANQEYRAYIGYTDGVKNYSGLQPNSSVTITVPLVFWDSGRFVFTTDGKDLFQSATGAAAVGAPFYYRDVDTQAAFYATIDAGSNRLNFTPIYDSFDPSNGYRPTTAKWKSPVAEGLLTTGMTVTGPGLPGGGYQITVDPSHPEYVTLSGAATGAQPTTAQYIFTSPAGQSIAPTERFVSAGFPMTVNGASSTNGAVLWYHSLNSNIPNNDAPFQLTEVTFRGTFYDPKINTTSGFQYLLGSDPGNGIDANDFDLIDYDVSFVDSINLPISMAASDATIPNSSLRAPFGWVGSEEDLASFQTALSNFTKTNPAGQNLNGLGQYFDGRGYPSYVVIDPNSLKLPSGQNLFLASPVNPGGGLSDLYYTKTFNDGSQIQAPEYALTSAGGGPSQLSLGGDGSHPSQGNFLGLYTGNEANRYALGQIMAPNFLAKRSYDVEYTIAGTNQKGTAKAIGLYYASDKVTIIGVELDRPVQGDAASQVYKFTLPPDDYAARAIASLWYSWANYYAITANATPRSGVAGTIAKGSNVLKLNQATSGLVPGMAVTGGGLAPGTVVLAVSPDNTTYTLSTAATADGASFNFAALSVASIAGYDPNGYTPIQSFTFIDSRKAFALAFGQTVYAIMSAWSASVPSGTQNAWNPLITNIIGGNLGTNYLPNANVSAVNLLTVLSKSALRGVPDYTSSLYMDQAMWYPDPARKTGGRDYNVFNLNPFVWFIHAKLGVLTGYAFALDDDLGNVGAGGARHLDISVGGLNGMPNRDPYTPVAPFGVVTTTANGASAGSSILANLSNANLVYQIAPFDYNHNILGTMVNGVGLRPGTTVQFTQISQTASQTRLVLSRPLENATTGATAISFFGQYIFPATVPARVADTITLNSVDSYNTLLKLGPLQNIQVTGPGIPLGATVMIKQLIPNGNGYAMQLTDALDPSLISQPGESYGYTFGVPVIGVVRDPGFEWATVQGLVNNFNHGTQVSQNTVDWTFTDSTTNANWYAGIAANGSTYTSKNPPAPQGVQVGFITGDSRISQKVTLGTGTYTLNFRAAQKAGQQAAQSLKILVDANVVATITPTDTNYAPFSVQFAVSAGRHTITFLGTQNGNSTVLIDTVQANPVTVTPHAQFVHNLYREVLDRPARRGELNRWQRFLRAGGAHRSLALRLLTSAEYRRDHRTAKSFVNGLYEDVLNRAPTDREFARWLRIARANLGDRAGVARAFLRTPEAKAELRELREPV